MTLTVTYTYVVTRAEWKLTAITHPDGSCPSLAKKSRYFAQLADLERYVRSEVPAATAVVLVRYDPCEAAQHDLRYATFRYWSSNSQIAYVRCHCGAAREVTREVWLHHHPQDAAPVGVGVEMEHDNGV